MPRTFTGRLFIDGGAKTAVDEMLLAFWARKECVQITPSKPVAWVLQRYYHTSFQRDQEMIVQAHFNSKEYFKKIISEAGDTADITEALRNA